MQIDVNLPLMGIGASMVAVAFSLNYLKSTSETSDGNKRGSDLYIDLKWLDAESYKVLTAICDSILPSDEADDVENLKKYFEDLYPSIFKNGALEESLFLKGKDYFQACFY